MRPTRIIYRNDEDFIHLPVLEEVKAKPRKGYPGGYWVHSEAVPFVSRDDERLVKVLED